MANTATENLPGGGWQVASQVPGFETDASGKLTKGVTIHFITSTNQPGTIFVPDSLYGPSYVREMIAAKVRVIDEIQGLTG